MQQARANVAASRLIVSVAFFQLTKPVDVARRTPAPPNSSSYSKKVRGKYEDSDQKKNCSLAMSTADVAFWTDRDVKALRKEVTFA